MKQAWIFSLIVAGFIVSCAHTGTMQNESEMTAKPPPFAFRIYQDYLNHLSAVRVSECPMYPSCSEYSKQCFQKYGFFVGWMMTVDRLIRCGRDEKKLSPLIWVDGRWKYYDPVEKNDFWWSTEEK